MEKLPENVDVQKKVSLPTDVLMVLYDQGYRYIEVSEFNTVAFYFYKPSVLSWYRLYYVSLPESSEGFVDFPHCSVTRLFA